MLSAQTFAAGPVRGNVAVPGDKSISHRALLAAASIAQPVHISNLNPGRDVRATLEALTALGTQIDRDGDAILVRGGRLRESPAPLDCMNSGSTARMLLGALAGAGVRARFDGDASLRRRPMEPVAAQLRAFGAKIETQEGRMPVELHGTPEIQTRAFILLAPSAQVKSALLFAGLFSGRAVAMSGDRGSRDHTERLLQYLGANVTWDGRTVQYDGRPLTAKPIDVAGDFSAAAFFITAAAIAPGSELVVTGTGVNPTRTGLIDALRAMGANIELRNERSVSGEPVADVAVTYVPLQAATIGPDLALRAIDEIPLLAIAAGFATGETRISGVRELRTKESDRIAATQALLASAGIHTQAQNDGFSVMGGTPAASSTVVDTRDDHRIAMAAAVLARGAGPVSIDSDASIEVSFPNFLRALEGVHA
ncbi:MAG: 3-phosphoshikimate 1-carboxyvinyltransferase [Candidatus Eremiobacteraeota bacterium]|nr:3-phosphoshikimate 1-carboxyvinyltransferase [Candidatus Eremiobacteraeota bacterium]